MEDLARSKRKRLEEEDKSSSKRFDAWTHEIAEPILFPEFQFFDQEGNLIHIQVVRYFHLRQTWYVSAMDVYHLVRFQMIPKFPEPLRDTLKICQFNSWRQKLQAIALIPCSSLPELFSKPFQSCMEDDDVYIQPPH